MTDGTLAEGTIVAQRLRVVRVLGEGGMGAVYEVEHLLTKHRRALKLLHNSLASVPGVVERFLREASAAGRIGNAHIVETFDAGTTEDGSPYLVMELLDGYSLATYLSRRGRLELGETLEIFRQVCDGVQAAHESGIVHRDLKPENIFLMAGAGRFVKILDFGISKFDPAMTGMTTSTLEGSVLGTPYYMPPEQVRGSKDLDASADVYALGVVLYECLVGTRPFEASTLPHLAVLIAEGHYEAASARRPGLPPELDAVIAHCLNPSRAARYPTARALSEALAAITSSAVPLSAHFPGIPSMPARDQTALSVAPTAYVPSIPPRNISAGTPAPVERTQHAQPPRRAGAWLAIGAAVLVAGSGIALWISRSSADPELAAEAVSGGERPVAPPVEPPKPAVAPTEPPPLAQSVAPVVPKAPELTATPIAKHGAAVPAPVTSAVRPKPAAASSARRSSEHGLEESNPFK